MPGSCTRISFSQTKILQILALLLLLGCFGLQVKDSLVKFFAGKTTSSVGIDKDLGSDGLALPPVILCPGYRSKASEGLINMTSRFTSSYFDFHPEDKGKTVPEERILSWWRSLTFSLEDFVSSISIKDDQQQDIGLPRNAYTNQFILDDPEFHLITVDEVSSYMGRCYVVRSHMNVKARDHYIRLLLDMGQLPHRQLPALFVATEGSEIGVQSNYWMYDAFFARIPGGLYGCDISLRREDTQMQKRRGGGWFWRRNDDGDGEECREYQRYQDWFDCALQWEMKEYLKANCTNVCAIPQADIVTRRIDPKLPLCVNEEDWRCNALNYERVYRSHVNDAVTGCRQPCKYIKYYAELREEATRDFGDFTDIFVFYYSTQVYSYEEYTLYDLNSIVAAVGGSLGLFLGFSCWQVVKAAIAQGSRRCQGSRKQEQDC